MAKNLDIWYVASHSGPLPSLFKLFYWGQRWPCARGHMFYMFYVLCREKHGKTILSETIRPRALIFVICRMTYLNSTKFVQIMPLGPKLALPQVSLGNWPAFNRYLYVSFKQNPGKRFRASWPSC